MDRASWRGYVMSPELGATHSEQADIPADVAKHPLSDEDIITYFCRHHILEQYDCVHNHLSNAGALPLERLQRYGISVQRPVVGETIAEAGNAGS